MAPRICETSGLRYIDNTKEAQIKGEFHCSTANKLQSVVHSRYRNMQEVVNLTSVRYRAWSRATVNETYNLYVPQRMHGVSSPTEQLSASSSTF